jgi:biopolymer transport protein ExbB
MPEALTQVAGLWERAVGIWIAGGWCMPGIALVAVVMFSLGLHMRAALRRKGFRRVPEPTWRRWIQAPAERQGPIGSMLNFVTGGRSLRDTAVYFQELRIAEVAPFDRDLRVMRICVGAAPLLGLLGTVTGMLATFAALASGSGGEQTMALVSKGISEALITTETGLVIALPGLFFQYRLARSFEQYKAFLAHLETACTQTVYRQLRRRAR